MRICVVGQGYVGLVTAACLAKNGNVVVGLDIDEEKIRKLQQGEIPIYEPGLSEVIKECAADGRLKFEADKAVAYENAELIFVCVDTPSQEDGSADMSRVQQAASDIGKHLKKYTVIVNKSTVPIGTSDVVKNIIKEELVKRGVELEFDVVSNPEFLKEGSAVQDFLKPDRIVVGVSSERAKEKLSELYRPLTLNGHPIFFMRPIDAEMVKYAANSALACKISFINQIAKICDGVGADIDEVRKGMCSDNRIGKKFYYPGIGYGGSCFPKDVQALVKIAEEKGIQTPLLSAVHAVNEEQKKYILTKIDQHYQGSLQGNTIALWGLSFKPETDDTREAPSLQIIEGLLERGVKVKIYDPQAKLSFDNRVEVVTDRYAALKDADGLILVTEWSQFRTPDFSYMKELMHEPVIFDGRNLYDKEMLKKAGFSYYGIGK